MPAARNRAATSRASSVELRRWPSAGSISGGFSRMKCFSPRGAPSSSISVSKALGKMAACPTSSSFCASSKRIGDGGRAADELRAAAIERGDALEAADDVGEVAAEHAAVGVQFVEDDKAQVLKERGPLGVMRQDAGVKHVGIGDEDAARACASSGGDLWACRHRRSVPGCCASSVSISSCSAASWSCASALVGKRYSAVVAGVAQQRVEHRQVVAQRLARRGGRDDGDVLAARDGLDGVRLMCVERFDAARLERGDEPPVERCRERRSAQPGAQGAVPTRPRAA